MAELVALLSKEIDIVLLNYFIKWFINLTSILELPNAECIISPSRLIDWLILKTDSQVNTWLPLFNPFFYIINVDYLTFSSIMWQCEIKEEYFQSLLVLHCKENKVSLYSDVISLQWRHCSDVITLQWRHTIAVTLYHCSDVIVTSYHYSDVIPLQWRHCSDVITL